MTGAEGEEVKRLREEVAEIREMVAEATALLEDQIDHRETVDSSARSA